MSDDPTTTVLDPTNLMPFDDSEAAEGQLPQVLGEVSPEEFRYIGQGLTADEFTNYVRGYDFGHIPPDFIILHHTAVPSLQAAHFSKGDVWDGNEDGLSMDQAKQRRLSKLNGLKEYYRTGLEWDRGPHLFIDDRYIWLFTPMADEGIHAMWGNRFHDHNGGYHYSIGIEVVGYYEKVPWPEPVARMVGHAVATLKQRLGTFDLRYLYPNGSPGRIVEGKTMRCAHPEQLAWGGIASHRDYNKPQCPGAAITEDFYIQVIQAAWDRLAATPQAAATAPSPAPTQPLPAPATTITETAPIFGPPSASQAQAVAYMLSRPHGEYTEEDIKGAIVPAYFSTCLSVGVDPILALAQMIHETDNLASFWAARPQRNPAGIGVSGQRQATQPTNTLGWAFNTQRQDWEIGLSFGSWKDDSIPAHVGRLAAYALPAGSGTPEQQALIARALSFRPLPDKLRGSAPILKQLGKAHNPAGEGWASPGDDYGAHIAAIAQKIVETQA
jgi:hypothetical protein